MFKKLNLLLNVLVIRLSCYGSKIDLVGYYRQLT